MFREFMNKYLGKAVDVDHAYGMQCVDLFNAWNRDYNNTYINCKPSGYARSLAENKYNNGILKYFTETAINNMIEGTVVVYGRCKQAPDSHVCFFIKDNGNGTFQALEQNAPYPYVTIGTMRYDGIIGAFIPKQLLKPTKKYINVPPTIALRRVYYLNNGIIKGLIKPKKYGGLSYEILENKNGYATIMTSSYGKVRIKITDITPITNSPQYKYGYY